MNPDIVGFFAALVSTGSLAPRVDKTWRSRSAGDFSYVWLYTALAGVVLWSAYGLMRSDWAITIANIVIGAMVVSLITMKRLYGGESGIRTHGT